MGVLGRPMQPSGLSKIEHCRRVDADHLLALALALDVTPNRRRLPGAAGEDPNMLPATARAATTVTAATRSSSPPSSGSSGWKPETFQSRMPGGRG